MGTNTHFFGRDEFALGFRMTEGSVDPDWVYTASVALTADTPCRFVWT